MKGQCVKRTWDWQSREDLSSATHLCNVFYAIILKPINTGILPNGHQRYLCPICKQTFSESFDSLYYRRHVSPEQIRQVLQAHSEGSSLRGISRTTGLAYNTVVSIVRAASQKAQLVHNAEVQAVQTIEVSADEMWSFVSKNRNSVASKSQRSEIVGQV